MAAVLLDDTRRAARSVCGQLGKGLSAKCVPADAAQAGRKGFSVGVRIQTQTQAKGARKPEARLNRGIAAVHRHPDCGGHGRHVSRCIEPRLSQRRTAGTPWVS